MAPRSFGASVRSAECILAIDPGSGQSAWLVYNPASQGIRSFAISPNDDLLAQLRVGVSDDVGVIVIEKVESYGMAVGREVFDTVHWAGRFTEAAHGTPVHQLLRRAVKVAICHDTKAKDANIRAALIDRFGGPESIRKGGPLYGISKDVWSALAIAVSYADGAR